MWRCSIVHYKSWPFSCGFLLVKLIFKLHGCFVNFRTWHYILNVIYIHSLKITTKALEDRPKGNFMSPTIDSHGHCWLVSGMVYIYIYTIIYIYINTLKIYIYIYIAGWFLTQHKWQTKAFVTGILYQECHDPSRWWASIVGAFVLYPKYTYQGSTKNTLKFHIPQTLG